MRSELCLPSHTHWVTFLQEGQVKGGELRGCTEQVPEMASGSCWQKQSCSLELGQTCGIWGASRRADRAVKWGHVTHDVDAWRALAYGYLWMVFPLTCNLDTARSRRDFGGKELVKCITKEKAVLSRGFTSKDRARPHYYAVSHIYLPFIPFLNWNTSSDHRVSLMWRAHPCAVMFELVNQHGEISETFGEIFSEISIYLRTQALRQLFCCSVVVSGNWSHI